MSELRLVHVTCPDPQAAEAIARRLVDSHQAACVSILPGLQSVYRWQGRIATDTEVLLLIKTTEAALPRLQQSVMEMHPDELPEIVATPITQGLPGYLEWVQGQVKPA